jgi:subtilisin-like proprotein convertase family protein
MNHSPFTRASHLLTVPRSRRALAPLLGGGLALLTGAALTDAKARFRTRTRTFANPAAITLIDQSQAAPYPSTIRVAGFKQGKVLDVNVVLKNIRHTWPHDIDVLLQAPNGRRAVILSDCGGSFDLLNVTLVLDDQAPTALSETEQMVPGRYRPTNHANPDPFPAPGADSGNVALATFRGINPNGTWKLFVVDDGPGDTGSIADGWALKIKARVRT